MYEILFSISSLLCTGFAVVIVKKGVDVVATRDYQGPVSILFHFIKNKWWLAGGSLLIIGWLLRFISISISDLSYVRMIFVCHLLVVVIGSKIVIKEHFEASLLIPVSIILSGFFFVTASPPLTRTDIGNVNNYLIFFFSVLVLFMTFLLITIKKSRSKNFFFAISAACSSGLGSVTQGLFAVNILSGNSIFDVSFYMSLLFQPLFYIMIVFSLNGYILGNFMAYKFKISLAYSIAYPFSEIIVIIGSIVVFNEDISFISNPYRFIGILLLMVGLCIIVTTQKKNLIQVPQITSDLSS